MYRHDQRTVMTLDAGGTNFVFQLSGEIRILWKLFVCQRFRTI